MASKKDPIPPYRLHKHTGQGYVNLNGRRIYLGRHDGEGKVKYDRLIAEWLSRGRRLPAEVADVTVTELAAAYLDHAKSYYGPRASETYRTKCALRPLTALYGPTRVADFGALSLKAIREQFIADGLCRQSVNDQTKRIQRIIRWGVENELATPDVWHAVQAVAGLRRGRCGVPEGRGRQAVPDADIEATLPHLSRHLQAIVRLLRLTGARPSEILCMRRCDIDQSGTLWLYRPSKHKLQYHGLERVIQLGPQSQRIILPFLKADLDAFIFSPADAERERRADLTKQRKTPRSYGNGPGTNCKADPKVQPGERYTQDVLRRAITRVCKTEGIDPWTPYMLRHTFASAIRREHGLEISRALCGHRSMVTTETYAALDMSKTADIVQKIG